MPDFLAVALLALALADSLPSPLYAVDGPQVAYTVAAYMDTTVSAWRLGPGVTVEAVIETPGEGEVPVLFVPRAGEDTSTAVEVLPPMPLPGDPESGACGKILSIEWR